MVTICKYQQKSSQYHQAGQYCTNQNHKLIMFTVTVFEKYVKQRTASLLGQKLWYNVKGLVT